MIPGRRTFTKCHSEPWHALFTGSKDACLSTTQVSSAANSLRMARAIPVEYLVVSPGTWPRCVGIVRAVAGAVGRGTCSRMKIHAVGQDRFTLPASEYSRSVALCSEDRSPESFI